MVDGARHCKVGRQFSFAVSERWYSRFRGCRHARDNGGDGGGGGGGEGRGGERKKNFGEGDRAPPNRLGPQHPSPLPPFPPLPLQTGILRRLPRKTSSPSFRCR